MQAAGCLGCCLYVAHMCTGQNSELWCILEYEYEDMLHDVLCPGLLSNSLQRQMGKMFKTDST